MRAAGIPSLSSEMESCDWEQWQWWPSELFTSTWDYTKVPHTRRVTDVCTTKLLHPEAFDRFIFGCYPSSTSSRSLGADVFFLIPACDGVSRPLTWKAPWFVYIAPLFPVVHLVSMQSPPSFSGIQFSFNQLCEKKCHVVYVSLWHKDLRRETWSTFEALLRTSKQTSD